MRAILTLALKDVRLLLTDKAGMFFTFLFPIRVAVFFGSIFGGAGGAEDAVMRLVVVDRDRSEATRTLIRQLEEDEQLAVDQAELPAARELVRKGKRPAYVVLPEGFGQARRNMFWGEPARLEIGIDPGRRASAAMLRGVLMKKLFESFQKQFTDPRHMKQRMRESYEAVRDAPGLDPEARDSLLRFLESARRMYDDFEGPTPGSAGSGGGGGFRWEPFRIETTKVAREREGPRSYYAVSFAQGMVWGLAACAATFGISLVVERTSGTLVRLRAAPLSRSQILGGKAVACFATVLVVVGLLLGLGRLAFGMRADAPALLALAALCSAWAYVGMMMLFSALGKTERSAGGIGWAVLMILTMLGGGSVPLMFMPGWLRTASHFSPAKWAILAIEGALWRGFTALDMLLPCGILLGVGTVCFAVGVRAFRWVQED